MKKHNHPIRSSLWKSCPLLLSLLALNGTAFLSHASLIGDTVTCTMTTPAGAAFTCNTGSAVVGAGPEFTLDFFGTPTFEIDLGANSVAINQIFGSGFATQASEILTLGDLDWVGGPPGKVVGITNFQTDEGPEIVASDVTFTDDSVAFNMSPNTWANGSFASWDLVTMHVPEPSPSLLFGMLAAGLGLFVNRG